MNPRILMIEDDASICDMTKMNLNMNGFLQVYCASDGEEGLAMAARLVPDLILLDIMLPGIDGLIVCRNLKNNPALADIPVIMLTAKGEENDIVLGLEMGADDYVTKPFSPSELVARVDALYRRVAMAAEKAATAKSTMSRTAEILLSIQRFRIPFTFAMYSTSSWFCRVPPLHPPVTNPLPNRQVLPGKPLCAPSPHPDGAVRIPTCTHSPTPY